MSKMKLRVLCLHGDGQNGRALREKSGACRSESKKVAEWVWADGPHVFGAQEAESRREAMGREEAIGSDSDPCREVPLTWWRYNYDSSEYQMDTLEDSIGRLKEIWEAEGPFDGVLGFSTGACLVAVLASRAGHHSVSG